jgi:coproporphyrinogen III oxidase-like Fe-S oxidoreductase
MQRSGGIASLCERARRRRMQPFLLEHLERRIPRYTSYPTAAQFRSDISATVYEDWLAALPADQAISIYISHTVLRRALPLLRIHTTVARGYTPIAAYLDLLEREISLVGQINRPAQSQPRPLGQRHSYHRDAAAFPASDGEPRSAGTIVGFGTSAIGTLAQGHAQNAAGTVQYRDAINRGCLATARYRLTDDDRFRWHIIERLMCDLQIDLADACRTYERNLTDLTSDSHNISFFSKG